MRPAVVLTSIQCWRECDLAGQKAGATRARTGGSCTKKFGKPQSRWTWTWSRRLTTTHFRGQKDGSDTFRVLNLVNS
jgi:hypothetical protein